MILFTQARFTFDYVAGIYGYLTTVPYVLSAKHNSCQCLLCESIYYDLVIINSSLPFRSRQMIFIIDL